MTTALKSTGNSNNRLLHTQEVAGSSPAAPTIQIKGLAITPKGLHSSCPHECPRRARTLKRLRGPPGQQEGLASSTVGNAGNAAQSVTATHVLRIGPQPPS